MSDSTHAHPALGQPVALVLGVRADRAGQRLARPTARRAPRSRRGGSAGPARTAVGLGGGALALEDGEVEAGGAEPQRVSPADGGQQPRRVLGERSGSRTVRRRET